MKRFVVFILFFWISNSLLGQNKEPEKIIPPTDALPEYAGGISKLYETINQNLKYPDAAKNDKIEGLVYVTFIVDTLGNVNDIKILRGIREDLDQEAIRVVRLLKGWTPGISNKKKVNVPFNLPIKFILSDTPAKKQ